MECTVERLIGWDQAYREALRTENKVWKGQEPKDSWKRRILLAEHSPIRAVEYRIEWTGIEYWVVMHLVRHHVGITPFVATQRSDRTGIDRKKLPQDNLISYSVRLNAQSIINISRRRLCNKASPETRAAWMMALEKLREIDMQLWFACVPECMYRGFCTELKTCGRDKTSNFQIALNLYRGVHNGQQEVVQKEKSESNEHHETQS